MRKKRNALGFTYPSVILDKHKPGRLFVKGKEFEVVSHGLTLKSQHSRGQGKRGRKAGEGKTKDFITPIHLTSGSFGFHNKRQQKQQTNKRKLNNILNVQFPLLWHSLFIPPPSLFRVFIQDKCCKVSMTSVQKGVWLGHQAHVLHRES